MLKTELTLLILLLPVALLTSHLSQTLILVSKSILHHPGSRAILESIYSAEKPLFERLLTYSSSIINHELEDILASYIPTLLTPSSFSEQTEQTRMKAAEAVGSLAALVAKKNFGRVERELIEAIKAVHGTERSQVVQGVLERALKLLNGDLSR